MLTAPFDLGCYLERVGLDAAPRADLEGLVTVQAAQLRAVPFENFDVLLRGGVDVESPAVFDKLVARRRGGYCFECNGLLCDALRAMGFDTRILLARVVIDRVDGPVPARTHAIVEARIGEVLYAVDCGFGAQTPRAPVRIADGAACDDDTRDGGWQLRADPEFGWRMSRTTPDEAPRALYVFDQSAVYPADIALGNHWTSTHPSTHFTQRPIAVRHTDEGRIVLSGRRLLKHAGQETREDAIESAAALRVAIREDLGIPLELTGAEMDRIWASGESTEPRGDARSV